MKISRFKNTIIELLNNAIYKSKKPVLTTVRSVKVFLWIAASVILLYEFGFDVNKEELEQVFLALDIILFFIFKFPHSMALLF